MSPQRLKVYWVFCDLKVKIFLFLRGVEILIYLCLHDNLF